MRENHFKYSIDALRRGSESAFTQIFHDYYNNLYNYALHYVIDREIAREMVQETFLRLWENRSRLKKKTNLTSLLYTITRNNSLNYLKHLLIENKYSEFARKNFLTYQLNYIALKDETSEQIIYNELQETVQKAINQLPPKCKEIFILSRLKELKHKEIASRLNISPKTVENQISEALRRIRISLIEFSA